MFYSRTGCTVIDYLQKAICYFMKWPLRLYERVSLPLSEVHLSGQGFLLLGGPFSD